jgi:division/cell wall cluster transcriptional repressor MraZ
MNMKSSQPITQFYGKYEVTVLDDRRIILPAKIRQQIESRRTSKIWLGKLPGVSALVICPDTEWDQWIHNLTKQFSCLNTPEGIRTFMAPSEPVAWDSKGRIYIAVGLCKYASIKPEQGAVIIGMGCHFELWNKVAFDEITNDVEISLRKLLSYPESQGRNAVPKE